MNAESPKVARRKRKAPPRRLPSLAEEREKKPIAFGWGAGLNSREREGLKERIALLAGVVLGVVIVGLLGWGLFVDNVWTPMQQRADDNKEVAQVGMAIIHMGDFKRFEAFQNKQFTNNIQQLQSQLSQFQADPKKNAAVISQIQQQISVYQQALTNLPQTTLNEMINERIVLQRAKTAGVVATAKDVNKIMTDLEHQFGGPRHFQQFVDQSGLSRAELQDLQVYDFLRKKLQPVLAKTVNPFQLKVRASHILIKSNLKLAQKVFALAKKPGANFAALAIKYSSDSSKKQGGDLGYFTKNRMVAPFANAAFSMAVGQIRFVQSQFGYHIIKVTGRKKFRMTPTEYQQAQSGALDTWIQKQSAILHVQRFQKPESLPNLATPVASVPGQTNPIVPPSQSKPPIPAPAPKPGKKP